MGGLRNRVQLKVVLNRLRASDALPKDIRVGRYGADYCSIVSSSRKKSNSLMSYSSYAGHAPNKDIAMLKGLMEYVERKAILENQTSYGKDVASDGAAAYPVLFKKKTAVAEERTRAYCESVERYCWATWWDNLHIGHWSFGHSKDSFSPVLKSLVNIIMNSHNIEWIREIVPLIQESAAPQLSIYIAKIKSDGYITGGSASYPFQVAADGHAYRGLAELARHCIAYRKYKDRKIDYSPVTQYEKRLLFFASGKGNHLVQERLSSNGISKIVLPKLKVDSILNHSLSHVAVVYKCLFENQPDFIGGKVERLCL
jgi:hypothetical protein